MHLDWNSKTKVLKFSILLWLTVTLLHCKPGHTMFPHLVFIQPSWFLYLSDMITTSSVFYLLLFSTSWVVNHPQAPQQSATYLFNLHRTLNWLHAPQLGLSCSGVSHRCSCLTFRIPCFYTLRVLGEGGSTHPLVGCVSRSLACLFIAIDQSHGKDCVNIWGWLPVITDHTHVCVHKPLHLSLQRNCAQDTSAVKRLLGSQWNSDYTSGCFCDVNCK